MRVEKSAVRTLGFVGLAALGAAQAEAQTTLSVAGREIQVHGFVQQGFVFTSDNSFLTVGSDNVSGAYRIAKPLELGAYYSNYVANTDFASGLDNNHVGGPTVAAKYDFPRYVSIKAEGHFLDGYGDPLSPRGFYPRTNTSGFANGTNMFVLRTAFSF